MHSTSDSGRDRHPDKPLDKPVDQKVAEVAGMLSTKTLHQLEAANTQDLQLYEFISGLIEGRSCEVALDFTRPSLQAEEVLHIFLPESRVGH